MIIIWWPAFIVPVLMLLCGLLGRYLPGFHYRSPGGSLDEAQQQFADRQLLQMLRQCGLAFAALAFMVMQSVRLLPENGQKWLMYGLVLLEVAGAILPMLPIERALRAPTEEDTEMDKGEHA